MKNVRWGIIGTGSIAEKFVQGLAFTKGAIPYAVASRTVQNARLFAKKHSVANAYGSYAELVTDPKVDVVYIATPNNCHYENTILCLNAGKAVLCEKPFALNSTELMEMIALAQSKKLFLMEAIWTRFLPSILKLQKLIDQGEIGQVKMIKADFGFKALYNEQSRLFNKQLGGGSVLDIGIYPLFLSQLLLGKPTEIKSLSTFAASGTESSTAIILRHSAGQLSVLASSFDVQLETRAEIVGTEGTLILQRMFHMPTKLILVKNGKVKNIPIKYKGNGYNYEADEVMNCLRKNKYESNLLPLSFSIDLMNTIDMVLQK